MAKEQFLYAQTRPLFNALQDVAQRSGVSRGQAFEDFLTATLCALAGGTMEDEYLAMAKRHAEGEKGSRGIDRMAKMFAKLVVAMEQTRRDILGDLFQGGITYGEAGQFLTPENVCEMMAKMTGPGGRHVFDPCCGSGRMLLAAANVDRHREFIGQDVDLRCVRITAINLALRNLYGYVLWGNSLGQDVKAAYRTGCNGRGFVRTANPAEIPREPHSDGEIAGLPDEPREASQESEPSRPGRQLRLF